jgi:beta-1,4-mannosyl-glycoprotein beta-1,4-N-acetylglucosaminyltransferase
MEIKKELKYDVFIFYNELDLLEIRLNILYEYVDFFIIVESTKTFTGKNKPLFYKENEERFKDFKDKIFYFVVDDCPDTFEEVENRISVEKNPLKLKILRDCIETPQIPKDNSQAQWLREFYQKESMKTALAEIGAKDEDICYVSDLDEIWNPEENFSPDPEKIVKLEQIVYSMYLNLRSSERWTGTYIVRYSRLKESVLNHLDNPSVTESFFFPNGGWHFTFQGGPEMIINKIENYGHQELNTNHIKGGIFDKYSTGMDPLNRSHSYCVDNDSIPEYLSQNREKYLKYLK